jgi:hypothetical protein
MIIGVLAAALLAGSANAETYECKVKVRGPDFGWISRTLVFHIPFRFSKTTVENTLIKATGQTTVHADLSMYSKKRITLSWGLKGVLGRNGENLGKFTYRATILRPSNRISVTALDPGGFSMNEASLVQGRDWLSASGKCILHQ